MAKLIVNPTSPSRREIGLARTLVSIGRDPSNDLVLPDAMVSRRHAVIEYRGSQYFLRDCSSSNGSLVNGDRVSERNLRDGDLVAIGTARLLFREEYESDVTGSKVVQHPSAPRLVCANCQADYRKSDLFCRQCGANVAPAPPAKVVCTSCGSAVPMPARFCNACGTTLGAEAEAFEVTKPRPLSLAIETVDGPALEGLDDADADAGADAGDAAPPAGPAAPPPVDHAPMARGGEGPASALQLSEPVAQPARPAPPRPQAAPPAPPAPARPQAAPPPPLRFTERQPPPGRPERSHPPIARTHTESVPAPIGARVAAGVLDALLVGTAQLVLLLPAILYWFGNSPMATGQVSFLPILLTLCLVPLAAAVGAVYYVYFWGVKGATPAKRAFGLAVEGPEGAFPPGIPRAVTRFLGYLLSTGLLGAGFVMMLTPGGALHDRIADTRVVRREQR